jgi:hypothetical protein
MSGLFLVLYNIWMSTSSNAPSVYCDIEAVAGYRWATWTSHAPKENTSTGVFLFNSNNYTIYPSDMDNKYNLLELRLQIWQANPWVNLC